MAAPLRRGRSLCLLQRTGEELGVVIGGVAGLALVVVWLPLWQRRQRRRLLLTLLGAACAVADPVRHMCRMLIAQGAHHECPVCHVDRDRWRQHDAEYGARMWLHPVSLAADPSWLDWEVSTERIVLRQYQQHVLGDAERR